MFNQDVVDLLFQDFLKEWQEQVEDSGETEAVFISTDKTGYVAETMYNYCEVKKQIEGMGYKMPVFIEGLKVTNYQPKSLTRDHADDDQYH